MGQFLPAKTKLDLKSTKRFKLTVMAGCRKLAYEQMRQLADDIHACARPPRS